MKKKIILIAVYLCVFNLYSQVGIGIETPASSAVLEVNSTTKGFLPPRLTTSQRNAIVNPANGLQIFNTTTGCLNFYIVNKWYEQCGTSIYLPLYPAGSVFCNNSPTQVIDVTNPTTGKTWMDRNLGATQVATSATDAAAYGDLYQWGRGSDGHQCRTSGTTSTLSSANQPGNGNFILNPNSPNDWLSTPNSNLWQGVSGVNNPCPVGYRLPTETEINAERLSWSSNSIAGAFASPLKLTMAAYRHYSNGSLGNVGIGGHYWTSTVSGANALNIYIGNATNSLISTDFRAYGLSVRCIKN